MPYIKIDGNRVTLAGMVQPDEDWVLYEGDIPQGNRHVWDEATQSVLVDPEWLLEEEARVKSKAKKEGEVYLDTGVSVPFTNENALAILQVKAAFELGVTDTIIELDNGEKLPMSSVGFSAFALWFAEKRNSYFV